MSRDSLSDSEPDLRLLLAALGGAGDRHFASLLEGNHTVFDCGDLLVAGLPLVAAGVRAVGHRGRQRDGVALLDGGGRRGEGDAVGDRRVVDGQRQRALLFPDLKGDLRLALRLSGDDAVGAHRGDLLLRRLELLARRRAGVDLEGGARIHRSLGALAGAGDLLDAGGIVPCLPRARPYSIPAASLRLLVMRSSAASRVMMEPMM